MSDASCSFSPRADLGPGGQQEEFLQTNCMATAEGLQGPGLVQAHISSTTGAWQPCALEVALGCQCSESQDWLFPSLRYM